MRITLLSALALTAALTACGSGGDVGPGDGSVASVTVAPDGLTLPVGGQGNLAAEVKDADGALLSGAAVVWSSLDGAVASVSNEGTVAGLSVGLTQVTAAAGEQADTVDVLVIDGLTLEVVPDAASVEVGGTAQFSVVARNGNGQEIAAPPVSWASSNEAVETIAATGVATGVTPGSTAITASAGDVTSPPATLTVTDDEDPVAACDGIASVPAFDGSLDYDYSVSGTTNGGWDVASEHRAQLTATLTRVQPGGPTFETWQGDLQGTASIDESKSDELSGTSTRKGAGPVIPLAGGLIRPTMALIVNVTTCTYMLTVNPAIHIVLTDEGGGESESDEPVAQVQIGRATTLGAWRQLGISLPGVEVDGHSAVWAALNQDLDAFMPLGFAAELLEGNAAEPAQGTANVSFQLTPTE